MAAERILARSAQLFGADREMALDVWCRRFPPYAHLHLISGADPRWWPLELLWREYGTAMPDNASPELRAALEFLAVCFDEYAKRRNLH